MWKIMLWETIWNNEDKIVNFFYNIGKVIGKVLYVITYIKGKVKKVLK